MLGLKPGLLICDRLYPTPNPPKISKIIFFPDDLSKKERCIIDRCLWFSGSHYLHVLTIAFFIISQQSLYSSGMVYLNSAPNISVRLRIILSPFVEHFKNYTKPGSHYNGEMYRGTLRIRTVFKKWFLSISNVSNLNHDLHIFPLPVFRQHIVLKGMTVGS